MDTLNTIEVVDRQSFIKFLELLHGDVIDNVHFWQNDSLPRYLDALRTFSTDIKRYYDSTKQPVDPNVASWKVFADILLGAKFYE